MCSNSQKHWPQRQRQKHITEKFAFIRNLIILISTCLAKRTIESQTATRGRTEISVLLTGGWRAGLKQRTRFAKIYQKLKLLINGLFLITVYCNISDFLVNLLAIFTYFQKFCNFLLFYDDNYVLSPPGQFPVLKGTVQRDGSGAESRFILQI